ncbi:Hypothetical protein HVR_LOCUS295 [uncultured virus]|nr:Hypothetical protein HVR_LOCUS295 [uncultured virus]
MPEAAEFLAGFHFIQGTIFANYTLVSATSTHESVKRYHEYRYNITLVFKNNGGGLYENLFYAVMAETTQEHIIYGIRNPYRCIIDAPQYGDIEEESDGTITFKLIGHSYRV